MDLTRPLPRFNFYDEEKPIFTHARFLPGRSPGLRGRKRHPLRGEHRQPVAAPASPSSASGPGSGTTAGSNARSSWAPTSSNPGRTSSGTARRGPDIGIGPDSEVRNAIIDKNARIGRERQARQPQRLAAESAENYVIVNGIIVVPKDAVIPDGTVI